MSWRSDRVRPGNWGSIRRAVLERDWHECKACGVSGVPLEVDHVVPTFEGGSDDVDNLVTLCSDCHLVKTNRERAGLAAARARRRRLPRERPPRLL